jgi:DNA-binding NarL/FixJ family response regulator
LEDADDLPYRRRTDRTQRSRVRREHRLVTPDPVRVLVLYSHPLMGEGLGRMLAAEPGVTVSAVNVAESAAVDAALAGDPSVIVVEEGGVVDAADVMRRSSCPVVLDVDITSTRAWTLRREILSTRPDDFLEAIRGLVGAAARPEPRCEVDLTLRPMRLPG